jgi:hypothetical protein
VANLEAEPNIELDAFGIERIVAPIIGWEAPKPRQNAERAEPQFADRAAQLADCRSRSAQIDRCDPDQTVGIRANKGGDLVIVDERTTRPPPGADKPEPDAPGIHRVDRGIQRHLTGTRETRAGKPAPQRVEHRFGAKPLCRMLHPGVDDPTMKGRHAGTPSNAADYAPRPSDTRPH